jgi:hypothetical protein
MAMLEVAIEKDQLVPKINSKIISRRSWNKNSHKKDKREGFHFIKHPQELGHE